MNRSLTVPVRIFQALLRAVTLLLIGCMPLAAAVPTGAQNTALVVTIHSAIGPASADFFERNLAQANRDGNALLIVELDTPGGLDAAMRDMIHAILASRVPVVVYVAPAGARAASAGTYLLYASHVAAMAPATNVGAATPINLLPGGGDTAPEPGDKAKSRPQSTEDRKAVNDAVAYIRSLAELRHRNADWAASAVRDAASLTASAALQQHVIDLIADDLPDLMRQLDGRRVQVAGGERTLHTQHLTLKPVGIDWRTRFLGVITDPNVAYLLMLVGIYGLLLEGYNPGAILPGVVGAISLLLALFAFQILSVNFAGLALIALGVVLIVAETLMNSFGVLGIGGITCFVIGSVMLMDSGGPGLRLGWQVVGALALVASAALLALVSFLMRSRRRPVVSGAEQLLSERAVALADFSDTGMVSVHGEQWRAHTKVPVHTGQALQVMAVHGLLLEVEPLELEAAPAGRPADRPGPDQ